MKNLCLLNIFLVINVWCFSQTTVPAFERWYGGFRYIESKEKIDKEILADMFDAETFTSYSKAYNEHLASIPLWIISGVGLSFSAYYAIMGLDDSLHPAPASQDPVMPAAPFLYAASGVVFAATLATLTPAIVLTIDSHKKLNRIASDYNNSSNTVYLEIGPFNQGVVFAIKF